MAVSNHKYIYYNKNTNSNCKSWFYSRLFDKKNKVRINKHFMTKIEALCFKFIVNLKVNAGHKLIKVKRNTWYE